MLHLRLWSEPPADPRQLRMEGGPATEALGRLSPDDQELLRLVAWESLDHAGIGEVLGISANAVAIRLPRARGRFAQELEMRRQAIVNVSAAMSSASTSLRVRWRA